MSVTDPPLSGKPSPGDPKKDDPKKTDQASTDETVEDAAAELTPEQQLEAYEESLKEDDWGHQPC